VLDNYSVKKFLGGLTALNNISFSIKNGRHPAIIRPERSRENDTIQC